MKKTNNSTVLYIVVPCYNEEKVINETNKQLTAKLSQLINKKKISEMSKIVYVDDGSKDNTWNLIESIIKTNKIAQGIKLTRNYGHQNALMAGLTTIVDKCDATITIDADLQDDINAIDGFVEKFIQGCQIVYGVRKSRSTDTFFKKVTAESYYKILEKMGVNIVYNHADYRLMSKEALKHLLEYKETNLFLRGMVPTIGMKTAIVEYDRHERFAGESKYPLKKMLAFALDGITSFSIKPIFFISFLGIAMLCISIILALYYIICFLKTASTNEWATIIVSLWGIGGLLLLSIGIVGIYIGKIYLETKNRPKFFIEKYIDKNIK